MTCTSGPLRASRSLDWPLAGALCLLAFVIGCGSGGLKPASPTIGGIGGSLPVTPDPDAVCSFDLATSSPDLTIFGADADDFLADRFSLATGDFNDDGLDDLLIGAPKADGPDNSREDAGEAYVILGSASPASTLDLAETSPALTVYGAAARENLGFTVAAGDVNGDGVADMLVGARFASRQGLPSAGKAIVIFGGPALGGNVDTAQSQQDVTIIGAESGDILSIALGSGDVNGDGTDDLILGASGGGGPDNTRRGAGEVHVIIGSPELAGEIDLAETPADFIVYGATEEDNLPNRVAAADLDGDGRDELLLGAPFVDPDEIRQDAGALYIIPFQQDGRLDLNSDEGFRLVLGGARRDQLGFNLATGDFNGDGRDDVLIGVRDADGLEDALNNSGEAHILFGDDLPDEIDLSRRGTDAVIFGGDASDSLGFTVAAGDVNGDSISDILVAAPIGYSCGNARPNGGEAFVVLGGTDLPAETFIAAGSQSLSFYGREAEDELGFSMAAADFNGDGLDDVVLGALLADGPDNDRKDAGEVYVIFSQ